MHFSNLSNSNSYDIREWLQRPPLDVSLTRLVFIQLSLTNKYVRFEIVKDRNWKFKMPKASWTEKLSKLFQQPRVRPIWTLFANSVTWLEIEGTITLCRRHCDTFGKQITITRLLFLSRSRSLSSSSFLRISWNIVRDKDITIHLG